jgi:hypothetical protein
LQPELVPNVQNENRSNDRYNQSSKVKFAPRTGRVKQMSHGASDYRADNTEHDCPRDREMRVHKRLGDATHEEADKDIPNQMKHVFVVPSAIWKFNP